MTATRQQAQATRKIAALTIVNAMIFQEVLAGQDSRVRNLRSILRESDPVSEFCDHWQLILTEIDYVPIFRIARELMLALPANPDMEEASRRLAGTALSMVRRRAAIRHDLMGRIYHRLLHEAKFLGTYYTSVPAATLLLKLTLPRTGTPIDWSTLESVRATRIADLACGTGTLLMAAAEAITDNYVSACVGRTTTPDLGALHRILIEEVIQGYDVLPSALHLTASTLALRSSSVSFDLTNLHCLPLGGPDHSLGSIELLHELRIVTTGNLFGAMPTAAAVTGKGEVARPTAALPPLDACIMNPPFVRSVGGNLLFGSLPQSERRPMQAKLARYVRSAGVHASTTAGLGSVFVAVADRALKPGGRLGLVLPKALLSGVSWSASRSLLSEGYDVKYLVVSHDPARWNFSENTDLSEVLIVAEKRRQARRTNAARIVCVNLWRNPTTPFEALSIAQQLESSDVPGIEENQGARTLALGDTSIGMAVTVGADLIDGRSWILPCAFAQVEITRAAWNLLQGRVSIPGENSGRTVRLRPLGELGTLGPDRRDIADGFDHVQRRTAYAALWGYDSELARSMKCEPNSYLEPIGRARRGRPLRRVTDLWPRAGRIAVVERLRVSTYRVVAVRLTEKVLSNVWWPLALHDDRAAAEKALVLWLNSTLGLLLLLASRVETEGPWVDFKKPTLQNLPVIDLTELSPDQLGELARAYDRLADSELAPIPGLEGDTVRAQIDADLGRVLQLPDLAPLRRLLAQEPIVSQRAL